jgi:hypothetical protein
MKQLQVHRAAAVLAKAPVSASAEFLKFLLSDGDEDLVVSLLAAMILDAAQELAKQLAPVREWLEFFPAARAAIDDCERSSRRILGESVGPLAHASPSGRGTQGYYQSFENGQIHWCSDVGPLVTCGAIAEAYIAVGGSGGRLGFPLTQDVPATRSPQGTDGSLQRFEGEADYALDGWHCGASIGGRSASSTSEPEEPREISDSL